MKGKSLPEGRFPNTWLSLSVQWADFLSYVILAMSALGHAANPTIQTRSGFFARSPRGTSDTVDLCLQTPCE